MVFIFFFSLFTVCYNDVAIAFVVDSSSAVGASGYLKIKEFIKTITPYFNVGQTQLALIDFTNTATVSIPFQRNDVSQSRDFTSLLDDIEFRGGDNDVARISEGLELANIELRNTDSGSKHVILITSSDVEGSEKSTLLSVKRKIEQSGVNLIVLGVGDSVNTSTLTELSTNGQIYRPFNFDDLIGSVQLLRKNVCNKKA